MKKIILISTGIVISLCVIAYGVQIALKKQTPTEQTGQATTTQTIISDPKNATYIIDGQSIHLTNGVSEVPLVPGSVTKIVTRYFGNEVTQDLDGDGTQDIAFILTQTTGGSGTFYYVVGALNTEKGYVGTHGLLLGDRIAPQTTEKGEGKLVVVNYADRLATDSFVVKPSIGKTLRLLLDVATMQFGEVAANFEGEANPQVMSLGMKQWSWVDAKYNDGKIIAPKQADAFVLTLSPNGNFSATTDCNTLTGKYTTTQEKISFTSIAATRKFCKVSQEADFTNLLTETTSYHFTSKGELVLDLKFDSGSVIFK